MRRFVVEKLGVSYMINYFVIKANLFLYQFALLVLGRVRGMSVIIMCRLLGLAMELALLKI